MCRLESVNSTLEIDGCIQGETGCGKSTRVPVYVMEEYFEKRRAGKISKEDKFMVLCTQPRLSNLSMLAWGFARSGLGTKELFDSFGHAALVRKHQLSARDLANLTWSFAAAKLSHDLLKQVPALVLEDSRGVAAFEEQDLSALAWGLATLRLREEELLQALGEEVTVKLASFTVPGLICTTWAFASLRVKAPFLREALDQLRHSGRLEPRGCSMMLWSLASLRHDDRSELFYYLMADTVILPRARDFEAQDVSNCLWAFATARVQHEAVFQALVSQATQSVHRFTSQALANTTWACAKMHAREAKAMVEVAADEALRRPQRTWSSQGLVTLCWASAEVQVAPARLLTSVTEELHSRPNAFNDVDLATLVFTLKEELWQEHQHVRQACLLRIRAETARRHLPATSGMLRAPPHGRSLPSMPDPMKKSLTGVWRIACISLANRVASCIKDLVAVHCQSGCSWRACMICAFRMARLSGSCPVNYYWCCRCPCCCNAVLLSFRHFFGQACQVACQGACHGR
ncbi:rha-1 [Symbiodinium microadriaticum]|nr:rha-1 [Symbiodinium microadriaticum]